MKELRAEDPDLGPIVEWMRIGQCPTNEYLKSKSEDTHKPSDDSHIQLVVPKALQKRLFEVTHAGSLAAQAYLPQFSQDIGHQTTKGTWSTGQTERHASELKKSTSCTKIVLSLARSCRVASSRLRDQRSQST